MHFIGRRNRNVPVRCHSKFTRELRALKLAFTFQKKPGSPAGVDAKGFTGTKREQSQSPKVVSQ